MPMRWLTGAVTVIACSVLMIAALSWAQPVSDHAGSESHGHATHENTTKSESDFSKGMSSSMIKMHDEMTAAPVTGDPDQDFLAQMIPHHAGAVEMARLLLIHGRDPLVRQLAEEIIAGQQSEIQAMQRRLHILQNRDVGDRREFPAIGGTRGQD